FFHSLFFLCCSVLLLFSFVFLCSLHYRDLHSFPTRRSSDLQCICCPGSKGFAIVALRDQGIVVKALEQIDSGHVHTGSDLPVDADRKSTRLNSSHQIISYAVFCLKKKKQNTKI